MSKAWLRTGRNRLSLGSQVMPLAFTEREAQKNVKITESFINKGRSRKGNFTPGQRRLLTGEWNPMPGWEKRIVGQEISAETAQLFLRTFKQQQIHRAPPQPKTLRYDVLRQFGGRATKGMCK